MPSAEAPGSGLISLDVFRDMLDPPGYYLAEGHEDLWSLLGTRVGGCAVPDIRTVALATGAVRERAALAGRPDPFEERYGFSPLLKYTGDAPAGRVGGEWVPVRVRDDGGPLRAPRIVAEDRSAGEARFYSLYNLCDSVDKSEADEPVAVKAAIDIAVRRPRKFPEGWRRVACRHRRPRGGPARGRRVRVGERKLRRPRPLVRPVEQHVAGTRGSSREGLLMTRGARFPIGLFAAHVVAAFAARVALDDPTNGGAVTLGSLLFCGVSVGAVLLYRRGRNSLRRGLCCAGCILVTSAVAETPHVPVEGVTAGELEHLRLIAPLWLVLLFGSLGGAAIAFAVWPPAGRAEVVRPPEAPM